jgi:hypothetical protein
VKVADAFTEPVLPRDDPTIHRRLRFPTDRAIDRGCPNHLLGDPLNRRMQIRMMRRLDRADPHRVTTDRD